MVNNYTTVYTRIDGSASALAVPNVRGGDM